jgi:MraZ protein
VAEDGNPQTSTAEPPKTGSTIDPPRGMYPGRLDDKGRMKLPAVFQKYFELLPEKRLFVTSLDRRTAAIYPIAEWRTTEKFFDSYHENPQAARDIFFNANKFGAEGEPDAQGRVTFNSELRKALKLENTELHLYAYRGHIVVMTEASYQEQENNSAVNSASAIDILVKAGMR